MRFIVAATLLHDAASVAWPTNTLFIYDHANCIDMQLEQEKINFERKLKLVEEDLDNAEDRIQELQKSRDENDTELEETKR